MSSEPRTPEVVNVVQLQGRVSAAPEARLLPSGDEVVSFRLVVPRSAAALRRSKQRVDTIECAAWNARLRQKVRRLSAGDEVSVSGELRRRFTRGAGGPMSWVSVDLTSCTRSNRAGER